MELSAAASRLKETGIAETTVPGYLRGALRFFDHHWQKAKASTSPLAFSPWSAPADVRELFAECLRAAGAELEESKDEKDVWHVTVPEERADEITKTICGVFHFYQALNKAGVYRPNNPFEIPIGERVPRRVPGQYGAHYPTIAPRFRFRIPATAASALRTDSSKFLHLIVPALTSYGAPTAVVMMIRLMIEGLARISEQTRITVWDWWKQSGFAQEIATTNKGNGTERTKVQFLSEELNGELLVYFDTQRVLLDWDGWGLDEWRAYLNDPRIPAGERRRKAMGAPLFPNARKGFYSRSGLVDTWYRPAMRAAGLPSRTHYLRHCGVNNFLAHVRARTDLTDRQKDAVRLAFAEDMGWRWPLVMLDRYSLPERQTARIDARRTWVAERRRNLELLAAGLGSIEEEKVAATKTEKALSRLVRHALGANDDTEERKAA